MSLISWWTHPAMVPVCQTTPNDGSDGSCSSMLSASAMLANRATVRRDMRLHRVCHARVLGYTIGCILGFVYHTILCMLK